MNFIKKHYEKIILAFVVAALVAVAGYLPFKVGSVRTELNELKDKIQNRPHKKVKEADLKQFDEAFSKVKQPKPLELALPHNLVNPVQWLQRPDGSFIKNDTGDKVGPGACVVTKISPLYFVVTYKGATGTNAGEIIRYTFGVTREAHKRQGNRRETNRSANKESKCEFFSIKEVQGPAENPTGFLIDLVDDNDKTGVTVTPDKPYKRVDGYMADLKYEPAKLDFPGKRVDEKISFAGEMYNVVAINETEAILQAESNKKRIVKKLQASR